MKGDICDVASTIWMWWLSQAWSTDNEYLYVSYKTAERSLSLSCEIRFDNVACGLWRCPQRRILSYNFGSVWWGKIFTGIHHLWKTSNDCQIFSLICSGFSFYSFKKNLRWNGWNSIQKAPKSWIFTQFPMHNNWQERIPQIVSIKKVGYPCIYDVSHSVNLAKSTQISYLLDYLFLFPCFKILYLSF